jgi:hypothetical protein
MEFFNKFLAAAFTGQTLAAQEYDDSGEQGFYGYTTIYYDPSSGNVTAYSETDIYGTSPYYYYDAQVTVASNGKSYTAVSPNPNTTYASASVLYQGVAGQTYLATGTHSAVIDRRYWDHEGNDPMGMEDWGPYDILNYFEFPFTAFSSDTYGEEGAPIDLGETYDIAEATVPTTCGDVRSTIIQEYVTYRTPYIPGCTEFTQSITGPNFSFAQLNSGTYSWAILRSYFLNELDALKGLTPFTITSGYRNPAKEYSVSIANGGVYHAGSRHQYGDAIDVATNPSNWATYRGYGKQLMRFSA